MYCFAGYQVILAEYFPAPHLDRDAPRDSREPHPRLCTRRPLTKPKCPGAKWWLSSLSLSLCVCIRIYIYVYLYCASMRFSVK